MRLLRIAFFKHVWLYVFIVGNPYGSIEKGFAGLMYSIAV